jgi:hypothetical protein
MQLPPTGPKAHEPKALAAGAVVRPNQAMETAIKASKKIKTAPASGKTKGIKGTTASTASGLAASLWSAGADMESLFVK